MTLYEKWVDIAYHKDGQAIKSFWDVYLPKEQKIYEQLLESKQDKIEGTLRTFAENHNMPAIHMLGFIDGINDAAKNKLDIKTLTEDTPIALEIKFEALYKKMVEYKAAHLYNLPQWDGIFPQAQRKIFFNEQKQSRTVVKDPLPERNAPCPCGSGKKYKKCCAR